MDVVHAVGVGRLVRDQARQVIDTIDALHCPRHVGRAGDGAGGDLDRQRPHPGRRRRLRQHAQGAGLAAPDQLAHQVTAEKPACARDQSLLAVHPRPLSLAYGTERNNRRPPPPLPSPLPRWG